MADNEFRKKLESLQFRATPAGPKHTVDVHDNHKVVVTERTDKEGDHQDVRVLPKAVKAKLNLSQEA